ncbi:hypothetical protein [Methylomonas sp. DH-1]|uniref:hypothetical protein n=1 Tax=Methylomonas sp. (strain DH-1) TaxID=1727196 RepID=UPI0007C91F46|nr:hypothetical protein [Methylomonas sp. DH-1]ANE55320.1 hypothetical protein AYM39_09125 [Methylomonas sp. DH-1]
MSKPQTFTPDLKVLSAQELNLVAGGLIGPEGDLSQFPRKFWPVINPGANVINVKTLAQNVLVR